MNSRIKIGLLLPAPNTVLEPDFCRMTPGGISYHTARMMRPPQMREDLSDVDEMNLNIDGATRRVAAMKPQLVLYGCTGGSFFKGEAYNDGLTRQISDIACCPAITTSASVVAALRVLAIQNLILVTPYAEALNQRAVEFLTSQGFRIMHVSSLGLYEDYDSAGPEQVYAQAREAILNLTGQVDGLLISCTNYPAVEVIQQLEDETGLPVVTSNQASLWHCLRRVGVGEHRQGYGKLLAAF